MNDEGFETLVVPSRTRLKSLDQWLQLDQHRYLIVRFVAQSSRHEIQDFDRRGIVHGPAIDEITCQTASRRERKTYSVTEVESTTISHQVLSDLHIGVNDKPLARSLLSVATVMHPAVSTVLQIGSNLVASLERRSESLTQMNSARMTESETHTEISVPGSATTIFVHPAYYWVKRELYLNYVDYLVLDYSGRRGRMLPTQDRAAKSYLKRIGPRGPQSARNEIKIKIHLGTARYLRRTRTDPIYTGDNPPTDVIDPSVIEFEWSGRPAPSLPTPTPVKLYEIAKGLR